MNECNETTSLKKCRSITDSGIFVKERDSSYVSSELKTGMKSRKMVQNCLHLCLSVRNFVWYRSDVNTASFNVNRFRPTDFLFMNYPSLMQMRCLTTNESFPLRFFRRVVIS